jgi:hypothetical protein
VELLLAAKLLIAALRRRKVLALAVFLTVLGASLSAYQLVWTTLRLFILRMDEKDGIFSLRTREMRTQGNFRHP